MKRSLSAAVRRDRHAALVVAGTCLVAGTYGLVRLAYGLFLPDIQASVAMGDATAGQVSSGASAAYCLGAVAGLLASDRPRLLVLGALGTASVGAVGMAIAPGAAVLVPATVLASAGAGLASPGLVAVVARNLPAPRVDRAQARVNSGTGPGLVAAGLLALLLPDWRAAFAVSAALTAAAGAAVLALDRPGAAGEPADRAPGRATWDPAWLRTLLRPAAGAVLLGIASAAVWTYGRAHLVSSGTSDDGSVVAWVGLGLGGAATVLTAGVLGALPPPRAWTATTLAVAGAIGALTVPGPLPAAVLACALFGWAFVAASSALIAWVGLSCPDRAAAGTSVVFIALVLGQAAGSAAAGGLAEVVGLRPTFVLAVLVAGLAACVGLRRAAAEPRLTRRPATPSAAGARRPG